MDPFTILQGVAAPLPIDNIDTDAIIPSRETQSVSRDGYAEKLFANWRYSPGTRIVNPEFVLNKQPYANAVILVAGANFGCGSSREAAVWSLRQFGIRAVIADSFGPIFYNNCIRNGLLPVVLPERHAAHIAAVLEQTAGETTVTIDLVTMNVSIPGEPPFSFSLSARDREMLLTGADEITLTLRRRDAIDAFREHDRLARPWLYPDIRPGVE